MIARSDSVKAIGEVTLVDGNIQGDRFKVRELGPIARFRARSAIGKVALMPADGDVVGLRIGEIVMVAGY